MASTVATAVAAPSRSSGRTLPLVVARSGGSGRGGGGRGAGRGRGRGELSSGPPRQRPPSSAPPTGTSENGKRPPPPVLPEYGYFAQADTKAPVYAPLAGRESGDVTKRGGRWSSDFIWNTNWAEQLDYQDKLRQDRERQEAERKARSTSGSLSLRRVADLNSMDVDLSEQLSKPKAAPPPPSINIPIIGKPKTTRPGQKTRMKEVYAPPSQGESRRWGRSSRFAKKVVKVATTDEDEAAAEEAREAENIRYAQLKKELQTANLGLTGVLFAATYAFYPANVAYSYLMGAVGGAQYLRMLNRSVESYGSSSIGGALGQQRVLIPVILALSFNRFNELASESTGITLQLLPMLAGFFTYKLSVIARSSYDLAKQMSTNYGAAETSTERVTSEGEEGGRKSAADAYAERILKG